MQSRAIWLALWMSVHSAVEVDVDVILSTTVTHKSLFGYDPMQPQLNALFPPVGVEPAYGGDQSVFALELGTTRKMCRGRFQVFS